MSNGDDDEDGGPGAGEQLRAAGGVAKQWGMVVAKVAALVGGALLVLAVVVAFAVSLIFTFTKLLNSAPFFATLVAASYGAVIWNFSKHLFGAIIEGDNRTQDISWSGGGGVDLKEAEALFLHYSINAVVFAVLGILLQILSQAATLGAADPPALLYLMSLAFVVIGTYRLLGIVIGGHSHELLIKVVVIIILLAVAGGIFQFFVGWGNIGGVFGEAAFNLQNTVIGVPIDIILAAKSEFTSQLSVCNNPQIAQIQCTADLYIGGAVYEAAAGSASVSKCVKQKIENQCGPAGESQKVTEPLLVEAGQPIIEPLSDHYRFTVPVTNTLVTDLQGRPIEIKARNVNVKVLFRYLGTVVASAKTTRDVIPNGDTATIEFNRDSSGDYHFPRYELTSSISRTTIQRRLIGVSQACSGDAAYGKTPTCTQSVDWFLNAFDGNAKKVAVLQKGASLSEARVGFIAQTEIDIGKLNSKKLPKIYERIEQYVGEDSDIVAPNRQHTVIIQIEYDYSAEAAFTRSSRWRSGNHMLKVFRKPVWQNLSAQERRKWRQSNCDEVTRAGVTFRKQRTASLTTPIVPVMYADCSGSLFNNFDEDNGYTADIPIQVAATVNEKVKSRIADKGFKITNAKTNCRGGGMKTVGGDAFKSNWYKRGTNGFVVNPTTITRSGVSIKGDTKTIGCRMKMDMRVRLQQSMKFPEGNEKEEGSGS